MGYRVEIYDTTSLAGNDPTGRLAILENAFNKVLDRELNGAGSFTFSLPLTDPKAIHLKERSHIKVFKDGVTLPIFDGRIMPWTKSMADDGTVQADVTCEGFATTLAEKVWAGQVKFTSTTPTAFYTSVLSKQSAITLGTIQKTDALSIDFSYDNLQYMLFKVPSIIGGDMEVDGNRKLNHYTQKGQDLGVRIEYGFNLKTINVSIDPTELATRIYGLGSSEGVNQTTIKKVNNGLEYIDADTLGTYGQIDRVLTDREITDPMTLKMKMETTLEQIKNPTKSFEISAVNLAELTGYSHTAFDLGDTLFIRHVDLGIEDKVRVVRHIQNLDNPEDITLEISNKTKDLSDLLSELKSKQATTERYPQGSMNIYCVNKEQNIDETHPMILRFPMPSQIRNTARVLLGLRGLPFQIYSSVGGSSESTTTGAVEGLAVTSINAETSINIQNVDKVGGTTDLHSHAIMESVPSGIVTDFGAVHVYSTLKNGLRLGVAPESRDAVGIGLYVKTEKIVGDDFDIADHVHEMTHTHTFEHSHDFPHYHGMEHTHSQTIDIIESTYPKALTIKIDGNDCTTDITEAYPSLSLGDGTTQINWDDIDIAPYLNYANYVHTLEIGTDQKGRIDAWIIPQVLVASE